MPQILEPKLIMISARAYWAVRSFVESSLKDKYQWNVGLLMEGEAIFTKPKRWTLRTYTRDGVSYRELQAPNGVTIAKIYADHIYITDVPMCLSIDRPDIHAFFIVPSDKVPFSYPICLKDLVDKMLQYPTP